MAKETRSFYEKGSCIGLSLSYERLLKSLSSVPQFVTDLPQKPELLDVILPVIAPNDLSGSNVLSVLWKESETGRRYHTVVVLLLHQLGLELSDPRHGTFTEAVESVFSITEHVLGTEDDLGRRARSLLQRVIMSSAWCGLIHYSLQVCNRMLRFYFTGKVKSREITIWLNGILDGISTVLRTVCPPSTNFQPNNTPGYLQGLAVPDNQELEPRITSVVPINRSNPTRVCKHGLFKRMRKIDGQHKMACILFGLTDDCGERE